MRKSAHVFVAAVFILLGLSFIASTVLVYNEFHNADPWTIIVAHSHLFIFFPLLGLVALAAFYLPAVIFTDHYWFHLGKLGPWRFLLGFVVVAGLAFYLANGLSSQKLRAVWEVAPAELVREAQAPPRSGTPLPVLKVLQDLRAKAQDRTSLTQFARNCSSDDLIEKPQGWTAERYCFPAGRLLNGTDCCRMQEALGQRVSDLHRSSTTRSQTAEVERWLLTLKVFFILVLLVIGVFLLIWRKILKSRYVHLIPAMERGIVIGAVAMVFWVLMDYGYQQTTDVLFGRHYGGVNVRLSLVFLPWAAVLLFYFAERFGKDLERVAQFATIAGAGVTVLRYQEINDWTSRLFGIGAAWWQFAALGVLGLVALGLLLQPLLLGASPSPRSNEARTPTAERQ